MARIARTARRQTERLIDYYYEHDRAEAADKLITAVDEALLRIDKQPMPVRLFPANYPELALLGMLWIKVHIYWIGYGIALDGESAIANVLWEGADIPGRVELFDETP